MIGLGPLHRDPAFPLNWLAHFVLSPDDDRVRLGNWLPDVLERDALGAIQDPRIREGIDLHRRIDELTDRHPIVQAGRERLPEGVRRFAAIVLDVYWDHFLTVNFESLANEDLEGFVCRVNAGLHAHSDGLTPEIQNVLARMDTEAWLKSYGTLDGVELTFERISKRLSPKARSLFQPAQARRCLEEEYRWYQSGFDGLWRDLARVTSRKPGHLGTPQFLGDARWIRETTKG